MKIFLFTQIVILNCFLAQNTFAIGISYPFKLVLSILAISTNYSFGQKSHNAGTIYDPPENFDQCIREHYSLTNKLAASKVQGNMYKNALSNENRRCDKLQNSFKRCQTDRKKKRKRIQSFKRRC